MHDQLNTLSYAEALEKVADRIIGTDALVIDMLAAPGFPALMVLVADMMPCFIYVRPDLVDSGDFRAAKKVVCANLEAVHATWHDISEESDLDWLMGEILHRTKPGEIAQPAKQLDAAESGFEIEEDDAAKKARIAAAFD